MSKTQTNKLIEIWEDLADQHRGEQPFQNTQDVLDTINEINLGHVPWETFSLKYPDEPPFNAPSWMTKEYRVWFCDPREVMHMILKNQDFNGEIDYCLHQIFVDGKQKYLNFMSANWAWNQAVGALLTLTQISAYQVWKDILAQDPSNWGSMFIPMIIGSDGTVISVATSQNEYRPICLSVGNVHNHVQHAQQGALVLIGFLAIPQSMS